MARGLKINNPGNIRRSLEVFQGEVSSPDSAFKAFDTLAHGYRAMSVIIYNYYKLHGCNTIRKIISRYAPPTDGNNTESYISQVATAVGVSADRGLVDADFSTPVQKPFMEYVIDAMCKIETAASNPAQLDAGYQMFVRDRL